MNQAIKIIPSLLSSLRLIAALAFPFCPEKYWGILVITAGISDIADGWLARKLGAESWQGGLIDAVADKLFVLTAIIVYASSGKFSFLWVPLALSRDILVLITVLYFVARRQWHAFHEMDARISGKIATGGQFILFITALFFPKLILPALLLASGCSILAAFDYAILFWKEISNTPRS